MPWGKGGEERLRCRRSRVTRAGKKAESSTGAQAAAPRFAQASVQCPAQTPRAESWPEAPVSWASFLLD